MTSRQASQLAVSAEKSTF